MKWLFALLPLLWFLRGLDAPALAQAGDFDLAWWTVDGGGGASLSEGYLLFGATGQPDSALSSGGRYTVVGGFWSGLSPTFFELALPRVNKAGEPLTHVEEVPNRSLAADDPSQVSGRLDPSVLESAPPTEPEEEGEGAHEFLEETRWTRSGLIVLAPSQSRQVTIAITEPALVQVRVLWSGSAQPVQVEIHHNGALVLNGTPYAVPPDHGVVTASSELVDTGTATVVVRNTTPVAVTVEITTGTLHRSLLEQP
jgi:hypothetical protein